jgi:hypothetical protein
MVVLDPCFLTSGPHLKEVTKMYVLELAVISDMSGQYLQVPHNRFQKAR